MRWDYNHGSATSILALDQVLAAGREPDFFELVKAEVLGGSLGGQPGAVESPPSILGPVGLDFDSFSANPDRHVLQIGVNIIDQSRADNFTTAIYGNFVSKPAYQELDLFNTVFGDKNLPMLSRMVVVASKVDGLMTPGFEDVWMQPEVWNPHDVSTSGTSLSDPAFPTPTDLRLVTYGGCMTQITESTSQGITNISNTTVNLGDTSGSPNSQGVICFKNPAWNSPSSSMPYPAFFDSPVALTGYGTGSIYKNNYQDTSFSSGTNNNYYYSSTGARPQLLGVWLGKLPRDPATYPNHSIAVLPVNSPGEPQLTFVLEYNDGAGFRPYCVMARLLEPGGVAYSSHSSLGSTLWTQFNAAHPDPRTDRFSASGGNATLTGASGFYPWNQGQSIRSGNLSGPSNFAGVWQGQHRSCNSNRTSFYLQKSSERRRLWPLLPGRRLGTESRHFRHDFA